MTELSGRFFGRKGRDMKRRVVVTGLGAVTPIGNTVEEFWAGIKEGKVGIGPITKFDASEYKVQIAAEVKDFVAKERMDFKAAKRMELFSQYAVAAAKEAFEDSGVDMEKEDPFRVGVIVGSGIGSLQCVEAKQGKSADGAADDLQHGGGKYFNPAWFKREVYECGDSMRIRYALHWRRVPRHSVRRR